MPTPAARGIESGRLRLAAAAFAVAGVLAPAAAAPIRLHVDLSSAPRRVVHASLVIPAAPGSLTLRYPKWLPGDHGPTGPVGDLAGMFFRAGGKDLAWSRDPEDMYAFRVVVPAGASELSVALDLLMPPGPDGLPEGSSASSKLAILSWNQVVLAPDAAPAAAATVEASVNLPAGWKFATALPVASASGATAAFAPVSLETLVDSPLLAGEYFRTIVLDEQPGARVMLDLAAESPADLAIPEELQRAWTRLVPEADALFGARHFKDYHFLVALSDQVTQFALEHHASSDNRLRERSLVGDDERRVMADTLPHEYAHSWNGKYRRPQGLRPGDYASPIDSSLLWIYEGLTQYLGWVLAARSGQLSFDESLDTLAVAAAEQDAHKGRRWRNLEDTAIAAQLLYETPSAWTAWRRGTDFYDEGMLIWLEADVTIRKATKGARSLDDFCRRFYGGGTGLPEVKAYTLDDVVAALNAVAPYDWAGFFAQRTRGHADHAPLGGIEAGGWALAYGDTPSSFLSALQSLDETVDERYSIGLQLDGSGAVVDVIPDTPLWKAGVAPGMKLIAVNERRYTTDVLRDAIRAGAKGPAPLTLIVENADYVRTVAVETRGGLRYPRLERGAGDDVLGAILAPKAGKPYNKEATNGKR